MRLKHFASTEVLALVCVLSGLANAQESGDYGTRPIRLIVPVPPGGSNDLVARIVTNGLTEHAGLRFIVDNRPGGGGVIAAETVAHAAPDGYTLLFAFSSFTMTPFLTKVSYDAARDFSPVSLLAVSPLLLVINPSVQVASVKELIALAKSKPKGLNVGIASAGSAGHLAAELFKQRTGTTDGIASVMYKGGGAVQVAIIAGEVQLVFSTVTTALPHITSGKVKVLASVAPNRLAAFPDVPTLGESNIHIDAVTPWQSIAGPAKMPRPVVMRLNKEINALLKRPEIIERIRAAGSEPVGSTPEALGEKIKQELKEFAKLFPALGLKGAQ